MARIWEHGWTALRAGIAVLILAAVAAPARVVIARAIELDNDLTTVVVNFFSYFTMVFGLAGAAVLIWAVAWFWGGRRRGPEPPALAFALAMVTTCTIVTGIVYNLQVPAFEIARIAIVAWSNRVLHIVVPLFFLLDAFFGPRRRALPWSRIGAIMLFPVAWITYTLTRASFVTDTVTGAPYWYPYGFLDPNQPGGYLIVGLYVGAVAAVLAATGTGVIAIGRFRTRRARGSPD